ncbi:mitochondrial ribosomal protein subunit-domain-containing protein [Syncephalis plumigaleata]|nr:mitochondrial ribosomal protein subunit-domain-containing protein [Syncephalis plumigaleata]
MSAEQSFARLLRTSRLASYDPRIAQVYTTHGSARAKGDWGLKRNLPTAVRTNYITVNALDTAQHQTPFESAQGQVWRLQRWREAFPDSRPPQARPAQPTTNIMRLTATQWRDFLRKAEERKHEWRKGVRDLKLQPDQHLAFMQAVYRPKHVIRHETRLTATALYNELPTTAIVNESGERALVGPTYDWWQTPQKPVLGRVLNRVTFGYAVGIGGVVGLLPHSKALSVNSMRPTISPYYVEKVRMNERGAVTVWLSQTPSTAAARPTLPYRADTALHNAALGYRYNPLKRTRNDATHPKATVDTELLNSIMSSYDTTASRNNLPRTMQLARDTQQVASFECDIQVNCII